jgi:Mitochondrial ATP synthase g subunit
MQSAISKGAKLAADFAKPRFATFVKYGSVELIPPTPAEIPKAIVQATKLVQSGVTFKWTGLTVREAYVNVLVVAEVACWYFYWRVHRQGQPCRLQSLRHIKLISM